MADLRGMRRGQVQIAIIEALAKGFIPEKIKATRDEFPGVSFQLHVMDNADVMSALVDGEMDLGIMLSPQSSKDLMVVSFVDVDLGVVTRRAVERCRGGGPYSDDQVTSSAERRRRNLELARCHE
jgi:DNA-binding transcriptional LysR family regulator